MHIYVRRRLVHDRRDSPHEWHFRAPNNEEREHEGARWIGVHPVIDAVRLPDVAWLEVDKRCRDQHSDVLEQIAESMHVGGVEQKVPAGRALPRGSLTRQPALQVRE